MDKDLVDLEDHQGDQEKDHHQKADKWDPVKETVSVLNYLKVRLVGKKNDFECNYSEGCTCIPNIILSMVKSTMQRPVGQSGGMQGPPTGRASTVSQINIWQKTWFDISES